MASNKRLFPHAPLIGWIFITVFLVPLSYGEGIPTQKGGGHKAVSFSNTELTILEDGAYLPALKNAIDGAKKEIALSFFSFKTGAKNGSYPDGIMASLSEAAQRGVRVLVLLEQGRGRMESPSRENRETMERLKKAGVSAYLDAPETVTHTKIAVIDGRYTFLGSHNLTQSALKYNHEISVLIVSLQVADEALGYIKSLLP